MTISDYILIDQALAALSSPVKGLINYQNVPLRFSPEEMKRNISEIEYTKLTAFSRECIRDTYKVLRQAKRYVISDDLLRYITRMSYHISPDNLLKIIENARPPNDLMWIEWNEESRQKSLLKMSGIKDDQIDNHLRNSSHTDFVGYLIENFNFDYLSNQDTEHWIFTPVVPLELSRNTKSEPLKSQKIMFNSHGFTISTEPWTDRDKALAIQNFLETDSLQQSHFDNAKQIDLRNAIHVLSYDRFEKLYQHEPKHWPVKKTLEKLSSYISQVQTRSINWHIPRESLNDTRYKENEHVNLQNADIDVKGDAKFLICVLSVLNYDWVIKKTQPAEKQKRMRYGKQIRYDSHIVCEIDLPKKNGVSFSVHDQDPQGSKRLHDVRGHFRRLPSGKRTWVREHRRGNKDLGVITKDYVLTSNRRRETSADIL